MQWKVEKDPKSDKRLLITDEHNEHYFFVEFNYQSHTHRSEAGAPEMKAYDLFKQLLKDTEESTSLSVRDLIMLSQGRHLMSQRPVSAKDNLEGAPISGYVSFRAGR